MDCTDLILVTTRDKDKAMAEDYLARTSQSDMEELMKANINDANKAIEFGNYDSAVDSLNKAVYWGTLISKTYGNG
jgi:hypothetical protein